MRTERGEAQAGSHWVSPYSGRACAALARAVDALHIGGMADGTPAPVEFWFEFASPYSYLSAARITGLANAAGVQVTYRPFLLGPIFARQGWNDSPFNIYPAKGANMWRDLTRSCARDGLPFARPSVFPRSGLLAARVATAHPNAHWLPHFVENVYRANFGEDRDTRDAVVLGDVLSELGVDARSALALANSDATKTALHESCAEAVAHGIFGAPSFVVKGELFWGNDRLEQALSWAVDAA